MRARGDRMRPEMSSTVWPLLRIETTSTAEIVNRADEDRAKNDPQQGGEPAPDHGERGPHDRSSSRDRGEVVAENDALGRWDEILAVFELDRGRFIGGIELEDLLQSHRP